MDALGLALEHGLGVRYYLRVPSLADWRVAIGPAAGADADIFYLGDWDDAHGYWMGTTWLGAGGRAWRPLGASWRLTSVAELCLVGLIGRPPTYVAAGLRLALALRTQGLSHLQPGNAIAELLV